MFSNIRIVLVNPSHPGNIGSAARAMKTMGFSSLYLVEPKLFPHDKAREMASYALDVLQQATVVDTLDEAIADCSFVVGTSARMRTIPWPLLAPREVAERIVTEAPTTQIAILFGREQNGLTNDELTRCHFHVHIPTSSEYTSLNLAAAVQVLAYELRATALAQETLLKAAPENEQPVAILGPESEDHWDYRRATAEEMEGFYGHLQKTLVGIDFLDPSAPRKLMTRLRRLFNRARPDMMEVNILRGMLSAVEKKSGQ
jgi:tRNA (cytidine32/uridine32-2'-O)-methyltransferase